MNSCFAYDKRKCSALKKKECEDCNFYKTKEEVEESRKKSINHIKSLDEYKRNNIIDTYYNGQLE